MERSKCKSCDKPIVWLKHETTGKNHPVDADPSSMGNLVIDVENGTYRQAKEGEQFPAGVWQYMSHFATCPDAAKFRKPKS